MASFLDMYPEIEMALSLRDAEPRVTPANAHAEIRMTPMQSQDYIQSTELAKRVRNDKTSFKFVKTMKTKLTIV